MADKCAPKIYILRRSRKRGPFPSAAHVPDLDPVFHPRVEAGTFFGLP